MRALLIVLDSVGIGDAPDAARYGDEGANTLGHILERLPQLRLPNLYSLGLAEILGWTRRTERHKETAIAQLSERCRKRPPARIPRPGIGKSPGVILEKPFAVFEKFPDELVRAIERDANVHFIGNYARSGTTILEELGAEHDRTGNPILYTSADSVLQIAAHEKVVPVERLYEICRVARRHADSYRIGRVIARPFTGEPGKFVRTSRRARFFDAAAANNSRCDDGRRVSQPSPSEKSRTSLPGKELALPIRRPQTTRAWRKSRNYGRQCMTASFS